MMNCLHLSNLYILLPLGSDHEETGLLSSLVRRLVCSFVVVCVPKKFPHQAHTHTHTTQFDHQQISLALREQCWLDLDMLTLKRMATIALNVDSQTMATHSKQTLVRTVLKQFDQQADYTLVDELLLIDRFLEKVSRE